MYKFEALQGSRLLGPDCPGHSDLLFGHPESPSWVSDGHPVNLFKQNRMKSFYGGIVTLKMYDINFSYDLAVSYSSTYKHQED